MERVPVHQDAHGVSTDAARPGAQSSSPGLARSLRAIRLVPSALLITRRWLRRRGVVQGLVDMAGALREGGLLRLRRMWLDHGDPLRYGEWLRAQAKARLLQAGAAPTRVQRLRTHPRIMVVIDARGAPGAAARASRLSAERQAYAPATVAWLFDRPGAEWARETDVTLVAAEWKVIRSALSSFAPNLVVFLRAGELLSSDALLCAAEAAAESATVRVIYADQDRVDGLGDRHDPWFKPGWDPDLLIAQDYLGPMTAIDVSLLPTELDPLDAAPGLLPWAVKLHAAYGLGAAEVRHLREVLAHEGDGVRLGGVDEGAALAARFLDRRGVRATVERAGTARWRVRWPLPEPPPRVSVIVPTRDQLPFLQRCVESVLGRTRYPDVELLVVDNQSAERDTTAFLETLGGRPGVRVLRYDAPFNFAALNNWAVRQANGSLVCLLNNDTEVISPGWLQEMVSHAVRPEVGAVGAMLYYPDDTIQHAGVQLGLAGFLGHRWLRRPRGFAGPHDCLRHVQQIHVVTAACLLIRRAVYEDVGGMDEDAFPIAYNDVDFCLRIREHGYRNLWTPHAELYHHESATRGSDVDPVRAGRLDAERWSLKARWSERLAGDSNDYGALI